MSLLVSEMKVARSCSESVVVRVHWTAVCDGDPHAVQPGTSSEYGRSVNNAEISIGAAVLISRGTAFKMVERAPHTHHRATTRLAV